MPLPNSSSSTARFLKNTEASYVQEMLESNFTVCANQAYPAGHHALFNPVEQQGHTALNRHNRYIERYLRD